MHFESTYEPKNPVMRWLDERLPLVRFGKAHLVDYPTPMNLNYWWTFGAILAFCLGSQIVTGIILAMHYTPQCRPGIRLGRAYPARREFRPHTSRPGIRSAPRCSSSRSMSTCSAAFYYGSYKAPREILWMLGVIIFLLTMATAFMGYVLPWGQMSFWGATVITNIFSAIPLVGTPILEFLRGGFAVGNPTLNRFFSLHYLLPFVIAAVVGLHIWALHIPGNNNPTGVEVKSLRDTVPFHPYATMKDLFAPVGVPHSVRLVRCSLRQTFWGTLTITSMANSLVTPAHIVPEWYLLPFYAMLRAIDFNFLFIDSKLGGVMVMFGSIAILFVLPWLDTSQVRSGNFRPLFKPFFWVFVVNFLALMYVGAQPAEPPYTWIAKICTAYYFLYFLVILPVLGFIEKPDPLPASISEKVLKTGDVM